MRLLVIKTVALLIAALSLAPSFAHALESYPRLLIWPAELWRETTVFNAHFWLFAVIGAPIDILAILIPAGLAVLLRGKRPQFALALVATLTFALGLILWSSQPRPACSPHGRPDRSGRLRSDPPPMGVRSPDHRGGETDRFHAARTGMRVGGVPRQRGK